MTINQTIECINRNRNLSAIVESEETDAIKERYGLVMIELMRKSNGHDSVGDEIERELGEKTLKCLKFVEADDALSIAWYKFVG